MLTCLHRNTNYKILCMAVMLVLELYFSPFISLDFSGYQWRTQGRGSAPPPLFLDQTEAQRAEKKFFGYRPPPPPPPCLKVWLLSNTEILQFSSKVVVVDLREISFTIKTFDFYNESPLKSVFIRQIS